ncbi:MAG: universal stress protein [Pseudomonadota bacterium]
MYPTLLLGVALDSRDRFLLDTCVSVAVPLGVRRVVLAHVRRHEAYPFELLGAPEPTGPGTDPNRELEALSASLRVHLPEVEISDIYAVGSPAEEILKIAEVERADLLLLGRYAGAPTRHDKGLDGRAILRHSACTALVVPEGSPLGLDHAVVGLDFSHSALHALRAATRLFARVTPVFGYHVDPGVGYGGLTHDASAARLEERAREHFAASVLSALPAGAHVEPMRMVECERPADALLQVHREVQADALVLGGHSRTRLAAALLGSTAERIAHEAPVPVLVVRDKAARLGLLESLVHR